MKRPDVTFVERRRKYALLGFGGSWYGLGHYDSLKEVRAAYRHCVQKGWAKFNLRMVRDETVKTRTVVEPR